MRRQALVRLSESLAKMRLSAEVSSQDVQEALRLFKVSTMAAASAGSSAGDVGSLRPETQQEIRRAEDFLKRRIAVRSTVNRKKAWHCLASINRRNCYRVLLLLLLLWSKLRGANTDSSFSRAVAFWNGCRLAFADRCGFVLQVAGLPFCLSVNRWIKPRYCSSLSLSLLPGWRGGDRARTPRDRRRTSDRHHGNQRGAAREEQGLLAVPHAIARAWREQWCHVVCSAGYAWGVSVILLSACQENASICDDLFDTPCPKVVTVPGRNPCPCPCQCCVHWRAPCGHV